MTSSRKPGSLGMEPLAKALAEPDSAIPSGPTLGSFVAPGPLGLDELQVGGAAGSKELVIIAKFPSPWKTVVDEVKALDAGNWNPSIDDFDAVARVATNDIFEASNFGEFVGAIQGESPKSIKRVYLITHSNAGLIAFGGTVKTDGTVLLNLGGGISNPLKGGLDTDALNGLKSMAATLQDIRGRFASKQSEIIFVSCHSASGPLGLLFLQDIADTFQVTVKGFTDSVWYCPKYTTTPARIENRAITGLGTKQASACANAKSGFKHLTPQLAQPPK